MIQITQEEYDELKGYKDKHNAQKAKIEQLVNAILDKLKREYKNHMSKRDDLRDKSIGVKILNEVIVENYKTQILMEGIKKIEELLK